MLWARELRLCVRAAPASGPGRPQGEPEAAAILAPSRLLSLSSSFIRSKIKNNNNNPGKDDTTFTKVRRLNYSTSIWPQCPRFDQGRDLKLATGAHFEKREQRPLFILRNQGSHYRQAHHTWRQRFQKKGHIQKNESTDKEAWYQFKYNPTDRCQRLGVKGNIGSLVYFQCHVKLP